LITLLALFDRSRNVGRSPTANAAPTANAPMINRSLRQDGPPLCSGIKMQEEKSQFIQDNRYKADTMSMLFQIRLKNH
jgi:hypothetical protein